MFTPKPTPLDEELSRISNFTALKQNTSKLDEYSEYTSKAITLAFGPVMDLLPAGRYCVAGGVIRALFNNELPNDVDVFLLGNAQEISNRLENLAFRYKVDVKKVKIKYDNFVKHIHLFDLKLPHMKYTIQFIAQWFIRNDGKEEIFFRHAEDVIAYFDVVPVCFAAEVEFDGGHEDGQFIREWSLSKVVTHPLLFKCLAKKEFLVNPYGPMSLKKMRADRFYKYVTEYGFRITDAESMKKFNVLLAQGGLDVESDYT
jgi:hypothetical protein